MRTIVLTVFGVLGLCVIAAAIFIRTGVYNVAANEPHWDATLWILEEAKDASISSHSEGIKPPDLKNSALVQKGLDHYHEMCRLCHGAPGFPNREFARGLYPSPPNLASEHLQEEWSDGELFWIAKNGLKMTGMPAFGGTHSDEDLWGTIAFTRKLQQLTPDAYREMIRAAGLGAEEGSSHSHGEGDHHH